MWEPQGQMPTVFWSVLRPSQSDQPVRGPGGGLKGGGYGGMGGSGGGGEGGGQGYGATCTLWLRL
jgi:hypothetical protein